MKRTLTLRTSHIYNVNMKRTIGQYVSSVPQIRAEESHVGKYHSFFEIVLYLIQIIL